MAIDYTMPTPSEISDVSQIIQTGMIRRGNPGLHPFRVTDQSITASFESRYASVETRLEYRSESHPIMGSVIFENGDFVQTFFNQHSFRHLRLGTSISLRPWGNHLLIKAEPTLTRYFSYGNDYTHIHNIFRVGLSVDFSYGNFIAYGNIISGPANKMYGEEIIEEKDMNQIMVGYRHSVWSIHVGVFNAFMRNYWMETRALSALAPYTSRAYSGRSSSYIAMKFNLSLDFGIKSREISVPDRNIFNEDAGIISVTK